MQEYLNTIFGVKSYATLVMSFFGAAVSLSYIPELTRWRLLLSFVGGTLVAVNTVPLVVYWFGLPESLEHAVAFFSGLVAMRLIPVLLTLVDRLKEIKIPGLPDRKE